MNTEEYMTIREATARILWPVEEARYRHEEAERRGVTVDDVPAKLVERHKHYTAHTLATRLWRSASIGEIPDRTKTTVETVYDRMVHVGDVVLLELSKGRDVTKEYRDWAETEDVISTAQLTGLVMERLGVGKTTASSRVMRACKTGALKAVATLSSPGFAIPRFHAMRWLEELTPAKNKHSDCVEEEVPENF